jgi:hypothetical protein
MILVVLIIFCAVQLFMKTVTGAGLYQTFVDPLNTDLDYNTTGMALIAWGFLMMGFGAVIGL